MQPRHSINDSYHCKRAKQQSGLILVFNSDEYLMAEYSEHTGAVQWQRVAPATQRESVERWLRQSFPVVRPGAIRPEVVRPATVHPVAVRPVVVRPAVAPPAAVPKTETRKPEVRKAEARKPETRKTVARRTSSRRSAVTAKRAKRAAASK